MITKTRIYNTMVDDYNGLSKGIPTSKEVAALRKISLLKDFAILEKRDSRERMVYDILMKCRDEYQMSQVLHDVLRERESLDEMLKRRIN